jgi:cystathionine gamma-synthase
MAEYCLQRLNRLKESPSDNNVSKAVRRQPYRNRHYAKDTKFSPPTTPTEEIAADTEELSLDQMTYLEERYGRNLDISFAAQAKLALRRRIAGTLRDSGDIYQSLHPASDLNGKRNNSIDESDVWLFPMGMSAIWTTHQLLLNTLPPKKSVCFG